ncbi:FRG domain-containing protein [Rhizobium ruizarguesonis]|uniref:FRG domain-containing protein n=1 Tax=Rhizobium ruizarguesonis TaxID=2081791 RepID=UPI001030788E|nr:FRG domain-containing protein [Rhizobium ruizarguesonis]NKL10844.1 FRG domain-containing protein [Rhizobium leguminosarum bv. viciae]NEJ01297.1 FRG domain-containing protein [Rhizobium ruizarguesonis]NEJ34921.1 FRG domain-containing protein [Rhizobium ruizarguesonis]TAT93005.1 FRG domain-containing protein [Rhizobium ruizarguesonis]TAZ05020.1 FRG domain-containing protein [Rhizobium ruizarguesonis]
MGDDLIPSVYTALDFPFLAVDLNDLSNFVANPRSGEGATAEFAIRGVLDARKGRVAEAFAAMMRRILVPADHSALFALSLDDATTGLGSRLLELTREPEPVYRIQIGESAVRWEELSPWPAAYSAFLGQMGWLVLAYGTMLQTRVAELSRTSEKHDFSSGAVQVIDQTSRAMPTQIHYAFASLGAWGGGAINLQYLSFALLSPGLDDPNTNTEIAKEIGYSDEDARVLTESGFMAVLPGPRAEVYAAQGDDTVFGALPADEWNAANLPALDAFEDAVSSAGLLIDKQYRTGFNARRIGRQGLYGSRDVLRDHYTGFYSNVSPGEFIRCKHYCVPIIDVANPEELAAIAADIPQHSEEGVFFRGQSKLYTVPRADRIKPMLFGDSTSREPSLPTAAARHGFDYDSLHFALRYFVQDCALYGRPIGEAPEAIAALWREKSQSVQCELDYAVMALAQHYGIPTHGLDVTSSLDIATWFATNIWKNDGEWAIYEKKAESTWGEKPENWPVIFACQQITHSLGMSLQSCKELTEFGITALRPERQAASFFHGGHGDHQNRLAETVVCAFRLRPGPWVTRASYADLFPAPEEDSAYKTMLLFRDYRMFASRGAGKVARYKMHA